MDPKEIKSPDSDESNVDQPKVEQPTDTQRIDALEEKINLQNEQISDIANEQEKIIEILEKISHKVFDKSEDLKDDSDDSSDSEDSNDTENTEDTEEPEKPTDDSMKDEKNSVETHENDIEEQETEEEVAEEKPQEEKEKEMTEEQLNALKEQIKNEILDAQVTAPEIKEAESKTEEPAIEKNWRKRYNQQVVAAWNAYRLKSVTAMQELAEINKFNYQEKTKNATDVMTIETADDFVLPVEVDNMIHGKRSNYTPLLNEVEYTSTNALQFAYATRVGDINMENVTLCDDTKDGNLKPISTYDLKKGVAQMEELAAVTPICDAATRYLAADILSDVAAGYRTDYDRKLAQLVIVRMQQAINTTGNAVEFNPADSIDALVKFIKATTKVSDTVVNGKFVFNAKTKAQLAEYIFRAAANGELGKETMTTGETQTIFGYPYVVVPNDLMPTLGEADTRSFKAANIETNVIETVTINSPVFYGDLSEFRGKTSGSLKYDVSAEASYEVNNEVRSAWQRNELIIRGSFNRGGYIADTSVIAGLTSESN